MIMNGLANFKFNLVVVSVFTFTYFINLQSYFTQLNVKPNLSCANHDCIRYVAVCVRTFLNPPIVTVIQQFSLKRRHISTNLHDTLFLKPLVFIVIGVILKILTSPWQSVCVALL